MNKKVLKRRINFIKDPIQNYFVKENHKRVNVYAKYYDQLNIEKNTILYESRDGNSITDSPYAIFKYLLDNPQFKDYVHIWSVQDFDALDPVISKYKSIPNVKFVRRNSKDYIKYLASCEYLINNSTFQSFYIHKEGQKYINTWHGTPLKHMGFDIPGNPAHSQNVLRNFLSTDYILSPNPHTTKMFSDSYKLNGLYEGKIIEAGYPRIDLMFNTNREAFINELYSVGLEIDRHKKNILYAPTWKGTNVSQANNDVLQIIADMKDLQENIGKDYNILVKVHPYLYKQAIKYPEIKTMLIPDYIDPNELQSIVDILITDYSSIFFDFLVTGRPILFYTWDADVYREERGQYIRNEDLPGPILYNCKELIDAINNIDIVEKDYQESYIKMQKDFTKYEDGEVTERIVHAIFNEEFSNVHVITCLNPEKEKILIYPGGLRDNGITTSYINLMNNIDYNRFDVTCFLQTPKSEEVIKNINRVNKNVRFLFKPGLPAFSLWEIYKDKFVHNRGERGYLGKKLYPEKAYEREQKRLFGNTHFDYAIDFSGYSLYWAKYLLATDAKRKICFMHNDLLSDSEKVIGGKRPHRINLRGLFSVYHRFDKLVSVSKGTMELNRKNLIEYADYDKFDYVLNTINPEKILQIHTEDEIENESELNNIETENLKSNAILVNVKEFPVWNTLPGFLNARKFTLDDTFENAHISVIRMATVDDQLLFKFTYNHQVIGWIDSRAVELTYDDIISEKTVDKVGKFSNVKGHQIWMKPYKLEDNIKVSGAHEYKGIIVSIDKEIETIHGIYCRINIKGKRIGWIDNRAIKIFNRCTILEDMRSFTKFKINMLRKWLISRNYGDYRGFINNLENRTLEESTFDEKTFAKIANPGTEKIWTKAYPNYNTKEKAAAVDYQNEIAEIKKIHKTKAGTYYNFSIAGKISGWLKEEVFEIIDEPILINEKKLLEEAKFITNGPHDVWDNYFGSGEAKQLHLNGDTVVTVTKEAVSTTGNYLFIELDGKELGWVRKGDLEITDILGLQVEGQFIPYPNKNDLNFVNMGRLSPEKAQGNLIEAFAKFHHDVPNSKLYILGKGPLKDDLQSLINKLGLNDSVFLMGQLDNPFPFIKRCDCFVLSSHYEGQPMVLLESMTLGMKIVATDIVANRTVLENGRYGYLVEDSVEGLVEGLEYIANHPNYQPESFDYKTYNEEAMQTFLKALNG